MSGPLGGTKGDPGRCIRHLDEMQRKRPFEALNVCSVALDGGNMVRRRHDRSAALSTNKRIQAFRRNRAWSQADLAARLKVSRQTVNALERGRFDPGLPIAFSIARPFGQTIEEVFQPDQE